ncbi:HAD-IIIA family hydrolase [Fibrobacterota bacterium]
MKLAIIAGGKGTRLGIKDLPKPMVPVGDMPILERQILLARKYGIKDIYLLEGHLAKKIQSYFGDSKAFGVNIQHIVEDSPLGTAGAVRLLKGVIKERFMVFYGDVIMNMDLDALIAFDRQDDSIATLVVHPNDHPLDSDLVEINEDSRVVHFYSKPHPEGSFLNNLVNAAAYIVDPAIFEAIPDDRPTDFGKDIFPSLVADGKTIRAYKTAEYLKDVGTAKRIEEVGRDVESGKVARLSKENKRSAVFIDRDGTLVRNVPLLSRAEDLELYSFTIEALKKINKSEFLSFLITNQPVVARNLCDLRGVKNIHNKLETILGKEGAYLNDIYFCPHHPDKGYPEENPDYKIDCSCRKPKTGMIETAVREYNVDMESSWVVGDTTVDIQTGKNAGLKTILVKTGDKGSDKKYDVRPDHEFEDFAEAVNFILS